MERRPAFSDRFSSIIVRYQWNDLPEEGRTTHQGGKVMTKLGYVFAVGALALSTATAASAQEFRLLSGFDQNNIFTREMTNPFMELVKKATDGKVTFRVSGPETVTPFEQLQPTAAGLFQVLVTHCAYHPGTTGVGMAADGFPVDPTKRRESGLFGFLEEHYQKHGVKLLSMPPFGSIGFQFVLKKPIENEPGLAGRKIRGTVAYHPMIQALGGSPVVMPGGDVYTAMERGVADGAAWATTGVIDFKWNEVAGYLARPTFGQSGLAIFMNLAAWKGLTPDMQKVFAQAGIDLELRTMKRFDEMMIEEEKKLLGLGMKITKFSDKEAAALDRLWSQGVLKVGADKSPDDVKKMVETAQKGGLKLAN
jgi:TRAP-type C4-dicarboxylate transport system substrate-binding protein